MRWLRAWFLRLHNLFSKERLDRELHDELASHLEMHIEDNLRSGMRPEDARRDALIKLGGIEQTKEGCREARGVNLVDTLVQDTRYGLRTLRKSPGFTTVAVLTLALGIGANTAIFSVVNAVLLRPLPYSDADKLVLVWSAMAEQGVPISGSAAPDFREWRTQNHVFTDLAAYTYGSFDLSSGGAEPVRIIGVSTTAPLFPVLGVQPALGRTFSFEEEQYGNHHEVVLSYGLWDSRFGRNPRVLGRTVRLNGENYTVIGVMPRRMPFMGNTTPVDLWVPLAYAPGDVMNTRGNHYLLVVARLKRGATMQQAQTEMSTIARRIEMQFKENEGIGARVIFLREGIVANFRTALWLLLATVGFVMLVACVNVANLLLARATSRGREFAIRTAMGAGWQRLIGQMLVEGTLLAVAGGGAGVLLVVWGMDALKPFLPANLPRFNPVGLDGRVLAFTLGACLLTAVVFGVLPTLHATAVDVHEVLKEGGRGGSQGSRRQQRLRSILAISELALAVVLLVGAGLLVRSLYLLQNVDPGFSPNNVLTMRIPLPQARYPLPTNQRPNPQAGLNFYESLLEHVQSLPGVTSAGVSTTLPLSNVGEWGKDLTVEGHPAPSSLREVPLVRFQLCSPGFFQAVGLRLRTGRFFTAQDQAHSQPVAIINETLAHRFFPQEDPLGKIIYANAPPNLLPPPPPEAPAVPHRVIVGVVGDVKETGLNQPVEPELYASYTQSVGEGWSSFTLAVRTMSDPLLLAGSVKAQVSSLDPELPVARVETLENLVLGSLSTQRFNTVLLGLFAALALVLASIGIYGVIAYSVIERTHDIGIRMALGAQPGKILRMVLGRGLVLAGIGTGIGVLGALGMTHLMKTLLFGVSPVDPWTFASVVLVLIGIALMACYIPARRAMRVDPMMALRYE